MADKGIVNNRKAPVTFTVMMGDPPEARNIVIRPGANRLSEAQHKALRGPDDPKQQTASNKLFRAMFKAEDTVERMAVPDPEKPGEMKEQVTKKRLPPKMREEAIESLDEATMKDHTKDEPPKSDGKGGGQGGQSRK